MSELVDAVVLAARNESLERQFEIRNLERIAELAVQDAPPANLHARFYLLNTRCAIEGRVTATLHAVCQRCMRPMTISVDDRFHIVVVRSEEEMNELPDEQDSIVANVEHFDLAWLMEEQLILATPLVPLHESADCGAAPILKESVSANTERPFAQLRELMKRQ